MRSPGETVMLGEYTRYVHDHIRTRAYSRALAKAVAPGDRVLDLGSGFGLLSMLAARYGAAEVFAVEQLPFAPLAAALAADNGVAERIRIIHGNSACIDGLPPVDLIVTEIFGQLALEEFAVEYIADARARFLVRGGRIVPARLEIFFAPIESPHLAALIASHFGGNWADVEGFDLRRLRQLCFENLASPYAVMKLNGRARFLAPPKLGRDIDFYQDNSSAFEASCRFRVESGGRLDGFVGYFVAHLGRGVRLSTGPNDPETHWGQVIIPAAGNRRVRAGDRLTLECSFDLRKSWHFRYS